MEAQLKIKELCKNQEGLRIQLLEGGCCGTYYYFSIDTIKDKDIIITLEENIKIYINKTDYNKIKGSKLDFKGKLKPPRFSILKNPNNLSKCACGRSFGNTYPGKKTIHCKAYEPMEWD